jgi:hypothetical protein
MYYMYEYSISNSEVPISIIKNQPAGHRTCSSLSVLASRAKANSSLQTDSVRTLVAVAAILDM